MTGLRPAAIVIIIAMPPEAATIAAISTPLGSGAIGIVRMTGPAAIEICDSLFEGKVRLADADSHSLHFGQIRLPGKESCIDEVLVSVMRAPATYTREDIVEVNCHGGPVAQRQILSLFLDAGARLATPGEFTKRAFLSGRLDLAQAESVAQIVAAKTEAGLRAAVSQLSGSLSSAIASQRRALLGVLAAVEADIDFSDEDIEELNRDQVGERLSGIQKELEDLIDTGFAGRVLNQGVRTAIVGKPNVGKSSLLNALLMRERAIVTEIPGTTRDTIEEIINVGGIPLLLIDTAGIRPGGDEVEQIGINRSQKAIDDADLILCLFDGSQREDDHDRALLTSLPAEKTVYVINKCDEFRGRQPVFNQGLLPMRPIIISALTRQGLKLLKERIADAVLGGAVPPLESPIITQERHLRLLKEAAACIARAQQGLRVGLGEELIAEELRESLGSMGEITGEDVTADLLDIIFQEFCIGK